MKCYEEDGPCLYVWIVHDYPCHDDSLLVQIGMRIQALDPAPPQVSCPHGFIGPQRHGQRRAKDTGRPLRSSSNAADVQPTENPFFAGTVGYGWSNAAQMLSERRNLLWFRVRSNER